MCNDLPNTSQIERIDKKQESVIKTLYSIGPGGVFGTTSILNKSIVSPIIPERTLCLIIHPNFDPTRDSFSVRYVARNDVIRGFKKTRHCVKEVLIDPKNEFTNSFLNKLMTLKSISEILKRTTKLYTLTYDI